MTLSFHSYSCKQSEIDMDVVKLDLDSLKDISSTDLTFKPKLNPKSNVIAQKFLNFYERQNIHTQKQLEIVMRLFFDMF